MLEARALECVRGGRRLFSGLDFALERGALLQVTGANGSGKTSLLRILCGLTVPHAGAVCWDGRKIRELREEYWKNLVYVAHANAVKDDLTVEENLRLGSALRGIDVTAGAVGAALERLGLAAHARSLARVLSQGQRRRAALARLCASVGRPLWLLDEPFTALDTDAANEVHALIGEHVAQGGAVVLAVHHKVAITAPVSRCLDL